MGEIHKNQKVECIICTEEYEESKLVKFNGAKNVCKHANCKECFKGWFKTLIDNNQLHKVQCPVEGCRQKGEEQWVLTMLGENVADQKKFQRLKNNLKVAQNRDKYMHCGAPQCDGLVFLKMNLLETREQFYGQSHDKSFSTIIRPCSTCRKTSCTLCGKLATVNADNPHVCSKLKDEVNDYLKNVGGQANIHGCPRCQAPSAKQGGCSIMTCTVCQYSYCWDCGNQIDDCHNMAGGHWICYLIGLTKNMNMFCAVVCLILFFILLPAYWLCCAIKYTFIIQSFSFMDTARKCFVYPPTVCEKVCAGLAFILLFIPIWLFFSVLLFVYLNWTIITGWPGFVVFACRSLSLKRKNQLEAADKRKRQKELEKAHTDLEKGQHRIK